MLGPLEVADSGQSVRLGGARQRATLGFLLLHANQVVASSRLIEALWPAGRAPQSARKILQNSVWRLRRALPLSGGGSGSMALLSQAPGYMLCVEPDEIDLHTFRRLADQGHAELAMGTPEASAGLLRDALALWRGPVLADLVETGIDWPELTAVQNARLNALEDYYEAELACGHHHRVLADLEKTVATEPLRERLLGQLMLALYRSGRQSEALDVYAGARAVMVDRLGLEPGRELRAMQQAVLTHDPALLPTRVREQVRVRTAGPRRSPADAAPEPVQAQPARSLLVAERSPERRAARAAPREGTGGPPAAAPPPRTMVTERREVSVLIARVQLSPDLGEDDPARIDEKVERAAAVIREEAECLGGTVTASIGPVWLALFGVPETAEDDAERGVHLALAVRDRLSAAQGATLPPGPCASGVSGVSVQVAVATGEAVVRYQPGHGGVSPSVNGALLDECHTLLSRTSAGEIRVCDRTRRSTSFAITYHNGDPSSGWKVGGLRQEYTALHALPVIDREYDLDVLRCLLQRTRHQSAPHLVTVLGEPGIGKTRFVMEFERRIAANPDVVRVLLTRVQPHGGAHPLEALHDLLFSCCGMSQGDSVETLRAKLTGTVHRLIASEETRNGVLRCLLPLVEPCAPQPAPAEVVDASRQLLGAIAASAPLVVIFEDLQWADELLLDFVENLPATLGRLPLYVVATGRPELLTRRPGWGCGCAHGLTLTLEPISDAAIDRLLEFLTSTTENGVKNSDSGVLGALLESVGKERDARRHNLRRILASGSASLRYDRCTGVSGWQAAAPDSCTPLPSGHSYR
ncbi:BTAD domain-containing putative transcriptional regulator [Streptomyces sp. TRM70308]|uniref:BTAD domain-containing putative transcriptional regulator n=1 Tax=Streptomyces sp. TRM70308 TaxID=3131932 RepID=UPI003CFCA7AD